ncbi:MAG: hypothetical protein VW840_12565 [Gammaproteobacteria bacterium]
MSTALTSINDILAQLKSPRGIHLSTSEIAKGIDNYHADVEISGAFTSRVRDTLAQNLKQLLAGKSLISGNSEPMIEIRNAYTDLMKVTMHRSKTDLNEAQISILQFAVAKHIISEIRTALDKYSHQLEETLGQQHYAGSRSLLVTQERVAWFRKHSGELLYRLCRLYLRLLHREENNQLKPLRAQILAGFPEAANVMCNPLLFSRSPRDPLLLLDHYAVWPGNGQAFEQMSAAIESTLRKHLPEASFEPLKNDQKLTSAQSEVYDELGGLFAAQNLLGPSEDQKDDIQESFSWLDHPGNLRLLFDETVHEKQLEAAREELGFKGSWGLKNEFKKLLKIRSEIRRAIGDNKVIRKLLASYGLREKLTRKDLDLIELEDALLFVSGLDSRKAAELVDFSQEGAVVLQAKLEECAKEFDRLYREDEDNLFLRFLTDYSRYRLHLKYFRIAHRLFNRISVITDPEKIQLARAGGNLNRLLMSDEIKEVGQDETPDIVHHAILKADVRGSTTVTAELTRQDLNPASYFSLRFFNPINECLARYGAVKVFIEGDAVILGTYEYRNSPNEWFSVSRACGMAKEMLDIVNSKNAHSKQTGLPALEIGIGLCYAEDRPMFLFDENRPIMISSAIGDADRMSSCSWRLRDSYDPGNFNVAVFQFQEDDRHRGEKGQELVRYNVNGILVDDAAFMKLATECHFKRLKAKSGDNEEVFYVGEYPDVQGKTRDLVVREGKVGVLTDDGPQPGADTGLLYYEVLPNSKFAARIVELARRKG